MNDCKKCQENNYCECEIREKNITILKQGVRLDFYEALREMEMSDHLEKTTLAEELKTKIEARIDEFLDTLS